MKITLVVNNKEETHLLAASIVKNLSVPNIITLEGDLGAGKTTFVQSSLEAMGYHKKVISPTFNILKCYFDLTPHVYHIDAYRLENSSYELGLEEYIEGDGLTFIEWPSFISNLIPKNHLAIKIKIIDENKRTFEIEGDDILYKKVFKAIKR